MAYKLLSRLADTVGDGTGTKSATGDYDGDPTIFKIRAKPTEQIIIYRMLVHMEAASFANSDQYGSGPALANGIALYVADNDGVIQYYLTDPSHPVTANGEWAHQCYDYAHFDTQFGAGSEYAAVRWTFAKSGKPVELLPGWSICVLCEDDLTLGTRGLVEHQFMMQGYYEQPRIGDEEGHA